MLVCQWLHILSIHQDTSRLKSKWKEAKSKPGGNIYWVDRMMSAGSFLSGLSSLPWARTEMTSGLSKLNVYWVHSGKVCATIDLNTTNYYLLLFKVCSLTHFVISPGQAESSLTTRFKLGSSQNKLHELHSHVLSGPRSSRPHLINTREEQRSYLRPDSTESAYPPH